MRWLSAPWCTLPTELSGPGTRPALTPARTRWFVQSRVRSSVYTRIRSCRRRASEHAPLACAAATTWSALRPPIRSTPPDPAPETICRSHESVAFATRQPSPTAPTRCASGTMARSRNTSLKSTSPVMWRSGRTSTPGWCSSTRKYVMPARFGTSGSVRASATPKSAMWAHVVQTFWPVRSHRSPSRSARVASDARSEPAPGSEKSWHHFSSLRTIRGRKRSRCSSVPWAKSAGAARFSPSGLSRPRLYGPSTRSTVRACAGVRASPPYATGHGGTTSPDAAKVGYHSSYARRDRTSRIAAAPPRRAAAIQSAGTCSTTHASTASTSSASVAVSPISTRVSGDEAEADRSGGEPGSRPVVTSLSLETRFSAFLERSESFAEVVAPRRELHRERLVGEMFRERQARTGVQEPLRQPERDRRPARELCDNRFDGGVEFGLGDAAMDRAPRHGLPAVQLPPEEAQLAGADVA